MLTLLISDVPGDDPCEIESGPTSGEVTTRAAALTIIEQYDVQVPEAVRNNLAKGYKVIPPGDERLSNSEVRFVAAPSQSLTAAADAARVHGADVRLLGTDLEGEARSLGAAQARLAMSLYTEAQNGGFPLLLLSSGECTVTRRGKGIGGPNPEFVLSAALELAGNPDIDVVACDTDGVDGGAELAGAYAGPDALERALAKAVSMEKALADNDAHTAFEEIGCRIVSGPTLTNVNVFRAVLTSSSIGRAGEELT